MDGIVKPVAAAVLLLALLGVAACGGKTFTWSSTSWPPPLPANALEAERVEYAALLAEAADRSISVDRTEVDAFWAQQEARLKEMRGQDAELDEVCREQGVTPEYLVLAGWRILILDKIREQEGMTTTHETAAQAQREMLTSRIMQKRHK